MLCKVYQSWLRVIKAWKKLRIHLEEKEGKALKSYWKNWEFFVKRARHKNHLRANMMKFLKYK